MQLLPGEPDAVRVSTGPALHPLPQHLQRSGEHDQLRLCSRLRGDLPPFVAHVARCQREVDHHVTALADDAVLERIFQHPAGPMPGTAAIGIYASEFAVHAWDLARALGRETDLDQEVAAAVVGPITAALPAEPRGGVIPFGPVVEVPGDAPAYVRLSAGSGVIPNGRPRPAEFVEIPASAGMTKAA